MSNRDVFADVAAILHPIPTYEPSPEASEEEWDVFNDERREADHAQRVEAENLRIYWDTESEDPLALALNRARARKAAAEAEIRQLIAYGREFTQPRPYTLNDLAAAAGMSISGVRTAYTHGDVEAVARYTGAKPREWRAVDPGEALP